ncbi:PD40 domain-containing protein, partial [candidate division TA06 bacterium]|nr:PD40 domain-containing protein [candidate division TA06 bacterium]
VLFQPDHQAQAEKCARLAEQTYDRLVPFLKWRPGGRTEIILTDHLDQANAITTAFPRRTIVIYLSQPAGQPGNYDDWMEELIVHEYTHLLDMDMVSGFPGFLCQSFGRLFLPNAVQPWNQIEGLAVYSESRYTRFGRNKGALYDGILRSYVNENKWPAIDQVAVFGPAWPSEAPYLFGGKFHQYLAERFGESKLAEYQKRHSGMTLPFMQNRPAKKTLGQSLPRLWDEWRRHSQKIYGAQIDSIKASGLNFTEKLTSNGFDKAGLDISPDGRYAAYVQSDSRDRSRIILYDLSSGSSRILVRGEFQSFLCFSPDGAKLAFAKSEYLGSGRQHYNDLYLLDIANGRTTRISRGLRAKDPAFSFDGRSLYFAGSQGGAYALGRLDIANQTVKYLTDFSDSCTYSHLKMSPDGSRLALVAWTGQGFCDIYSYDIAQAEFQTLFCDQTQELCPSWSQDGRMVYFSSDRSGIWNTYSYDLNQKTISRLTNVVGGSLFPNILNDSTILYLDLSARGYDLVKAQTGNYPVTKAVILDPEIFQPAKQFQRTEYQIKKYQPLKTMMPVLWFPTAFTDEKDGALGVSLWGWDALLQRNYYLSAGASPSNHRFYFDLQYADQSLSLPVSLTLRDYPAGYNVNISGQDTVYWQREQEQTLSFGWPFKRSDYSLTPSIRFRHQRLMGLNYLIDGVYNPYWTGNLCDISTAVSFSNYKIYRNSISPQDGRRIFARAAFYHETWGSDLDQTYLFGLWNEYLSLSFSRQVLKASLRADAYYARSQVYRETNNWLNLRGYDQAETIGPRRLAVTLEYRLPLVDIQRGISTWPIYFKNIHAAAFWDAGAGAYSFSDLRSKTFKQSLGAELVTDWTVFYSLPSSFKVGLVRALQRSQKYSLYLTFTQDILGI